VFYKIYQNRLDFILNRIDTFCTSRNRLPTLSQTLLIDKKRLKIKAYLKALQFSSHVSRMTSSAVRRQSPIWAILEIFEFCLIWPRPQSHFRVRRTLRTIQGQGLSNESKFVKIGRLEPEI
jgi:hypothetical protein